MRWEKHENAHPSAPLGGGKWGRNRRGLVRTSEMTLSGVGRCSGRGRACRASHSGAIAHASGWFAMPHSGLLRAGSHGCINPHRGCPLQREGMRARGHAQRANAHACRSAFSMKNQFEFCFVCPLIGPLYAGCRNVLPVPVAHALFKNK
jgi:hypothetical protein